MATRFHRVRVLPSWTPIALGMVVGLGYAVWNAGLIPALPVGRLMDDWRLAAAGGIMVVGAFGLYRYQAAIVIILLLLSVAGFVVGWELLAPMAEALTEVVA